jgi:hypothetical protein
VQEGGARDGRVQEGRSKGWEIARGWKQGLEGTKSAGSKGLEANVNRQEMGANDGTRVEQGMVMGAKEL